MDSVCSLTLYTLYRGVVVPPLRPLLLPTSPSLESPPPPHSSSTHLLPPPPPPRPLSSDVVASFSPFWNFYWQQPVALLMCACMRERRSRVYKRLRYKREFVWMCTPTATFSGNEWKKEEGRRKKEERRKEETETAKRERRRRRKERRKKNKRKSNRLDWWKWIQNGRSRLSLRLKWRRDFNSRLLRANMTFLFVIPLIKSRVARDILPSSE